MTQQNFKVQKIIKKYLAKILSLAKFTGLRIFWCFGFKHFLQYRVVTGNSSGHSHSPGQGRWWPGGWVSSALSGAYVQQSREGQSRCLSTMLPPLEWWVLVEALGGLVGLCPWVALLAACGGLIRALGLRGCLCASGSEFQGRADVF